MMRRVEPRPTHVAYVAHYSGGGSAVSLRTLLEYLDRERFRPDVIFHRVKNPALVAALEDQGISVASLVAPRAVVAKSENDQLKLTGWLRQHGHNERFPGFFDAARAARRMLKDDARWIPSLARSLQRVGPSLVHCNNGLSHHCLDLLLCAALGIPTICHVRTFETVSVLERLAAMTVRRIIYVSHAVAACHHQQGIAPEKGVVIPNAVAIQTIGAPDPGLRSEFGWGPEHFVVINVGRLVSWKGQDVFLHAVAQLSARTPHVRALIVGGADDNEASRDFAEKLHRLPEALGISERVAFTGRRPDALQLMGAADVVVHSAIRPEPFGRVVIEAMAAGRPIVASEAGGVLDVVEHEVTGLLVPPGDANALATTLGRMAAAPDLVTRLARAGRHHAMAHFTASQHAARIMEVYQDCLSEVSRKQVIQIPAKSDVPTNSVRE